VTKRRNRNIHLQPIEEVVRLAIADLIGNAGDVELERHSYEWRPDDLLVWVQVRQPVCGSVLALLRRELARKMHVLLPRGQPCDDWLIVVECNGETLSTVSWDDEFEEPGHEAGEA
jgi:hypothetical protein